MLLPKEEETLQKSKKKKKENNQNVRNFAFAHVGYVDTRLVNSWSAPSQYFTINNHNFHQNNVFTTDIVTVVKS